MRVSRIYVDQPLAVDVEVILPDEAVRHLIQVLRLGPGASVVLFNGDGIEYFAHLQSVSKRNATALVESARQKNTESSLRIHLGQAISRGDRMDYAIQKAVELGVSRITPLETERTNLSLNAERSQKKHEHWWGVIQSACEQSGRNVLPLLEPVTSFDRWCAEKTERELGVVLAPGGEKGFGGLTESPVELRLIIGPEGGFSEPELALASRYGFVCVGLGPRILRTETATVAALAIVQSLWGDL